VDNFRVESLAAPVVITITKVEVIGSNAKLTFTGPAATPAASFKVYSSSIVTGTYTDTGVTPTSAGSGIFEALVPLSGPTQFYKIYLP
jgi:hypothetical protein